jgi:MFS family permease
MSGAPVWTVREAVKNKNFWLLPIGYGFLFMCSNGFLSQMVPYQIEQIRGPIVAGLMQTGNFPNIGAAIGAAMADGTIAAKAGGYMMILPAFAIPGSIFSGWLDQKFGTRRTGMVMAIFYAIAGFAGGLMPFNTVTNWIFMGTFFFWTGANANLVMSHASSTFGPRDYPMLWGRMAPIFTLMRIFAPMVLSLFLVKAATAVVGYRNSYTFFGCAAIFALIFIFFTDQHVFKKPGEAPTGVTKT